MSIQYIVNLENKRIPIDVGNKAINLHRLHARHFPIPPSWAICWGAYQHFQQDEEVIRVQLRKELSKFIDPAKCYAVRSSANVEDSFDHSFAGQFKTILNVQGVEALLEAIQEIWSAMDTENVRSYLDKSVLSAQKLAMGVIIQEMVKAEISGVAFSRNPITALDEIVIEAVPGSGVVLVQEGITPSRWVNKWGKWIEQSHPDLLSAELAQAIVHETKKIAHAFRADVDLEWSWDGTRLYWLQMRDITSIRNMRIYTNRISKEMLPGMIKPLVWSINVPMTTGEWVHLLGEIVNLNHIEPESLVKSFYYRAYFDMGTFGQIFEKMGMPRESLEMMMGMLPAGQDRPKFMPRADMIKNFPRMVAFAFDKWTIGSRVEKNIERLRSQFGEYSTKEAASMDEHNLLDDLEKLYEIERETTRLNIIIPLMMMMYNAVLKRQLRDLGIDFRSFDLTEGMQEIKAYDPATQLEELHDLYIKLDPETQNRIISSDLIASSDQPDLDLFQLEFSRFIDRFGYLSDNSNDFSTVPWREDPHVVLKLIAGYKYSGDRSDGKVRLADLNLRGMKGRALRIFYKRAREFRLYREKISSLHTYGLDLLRAYYLALGDRQVERGWLDKAEDIFYLYKQEIIQVIQGVRSGDELRRLAAIRQQEIDEAVDIQLPDIIYGDQPPPIIPNSLSKLRGSPTSPGYYTGPIKVIRGIAEFSKLEPGDVLVIPYSDVGWTPLFAKAGALIAESGGILSHSSIIAREYCIPAIVSVNGALNLPDKSLVTVDGFQGEIIIHDKSTG
jgi:phosphohistidine swiveling domain-containing protein